ncbi:N-acetyltransferase family protein [Ekhidna sp. To15]|uniref:GNAT family N-acetyltransferase n=1 Tax=Ekhidna sp. To15 TaxID=3395267 RepID=UPI003F520120
MLIRRAEERDIDQLLVLCELHAEYEKCEYDPAGKRGKLFRQLFEGNDLQCIVIEYSEELLGYATFIKQFSTWDADFYLYLDCIYLKEKYRGQGMGTKLMQLVKSYAEQEGCFEIQWQTPIFNREAIRFYKRIGSVSKEKERFFWVL